MNMNIHQPIEIPTGFNESPLAAIGELMQNHELEYALAIEDDGITLGKRQKDGTLATKTPAFLTDGPHKIQQLYLFGPTGQILIWRKDEGFCISRIDDQQLPPNDEYGLVSHYDDIHMLWGNAAETQPADTFTMMQEADRGFRFWIPLTIEPPQQAGLVVRHYLQQDEDGQCYVPYSRLVDIVQIQEGKGARAK